MLAKNNIDLRYYWSMRGRLEVGKVNIQHFYLLVDIVGVKNEKMVSALKDVLVFGKSRKQACEENGVPQSYLSIKLKQLQNVSGLICNAYIYYLHS